MARYLDPKNDLTFKRIFGEHPDLLISFLNALMPLAPEQ
ncbi:MAG: Rpn family recombination-promoting nuclease/putative transposase, partial [Prevotellaceae bacterium]|nr:Rpn family recombination-promoting nuclease/putative transposase [Prevotellaceae bacterium]